METQAEYNVTPPPSMQSPDIGKLADALAKAQAEMSAAKKDAKNPFFKSDYATLHSCLAAGNPPLNKQGLCVTQLPGSDNGNVTVETILMHTSGQFIKSRLSVKPQKTDPQALGSCLSYLRRYSYSAIIGQSVSEDLDDDAEKTMSRPDVGKKTPPKTKTPTEAQKKAAFLKAVTPIAEKMGPDIFDAFLSDRGVKSLDDLKTSKERNDFFKALKAA